MNVAKVLVSIDDHLLRWIDRAARAAGVSRSAYLSQLAERERAQRIGPGATAESRRALASLDKLFADTRPGDSAALIRADRDAR